MKKAIPENLRVFLSLLFLVLKLWIIIHFIYQGQTSFIYQNF